LLTYSDQFGAINEVSHWVQTIPQGERLSMTILSVPPPFVFVLYDTGTQKHHDI
jgi:hypothetical protein